MTPEELWKLFTAKYPQYKGKAYDTFTFGDQPDELLRLVLIGKKTATCSIYRGDISKLGSMSVVLDSKGEAKAIIRTIKVTIVPFNRVSADFARKEGEGDGSLAVWRQIHLAYWGDIAQDTLLECEEFELLYHQ